MCMRVERRYKGKGRKVYTGWKVFLRDGSKLRPQFQHRYMHFERKCWTGPTSRPGFHICKKRPAPSGFPYVTRRVLIKGLLGESPYHYTARYLWVN